MSRTLALVLVTLLVTAVGFVGGGCPTGCRNCKCFYTAKTLGGDMTAATDKAGNPIGYCEPKMLTNNPIASKTCKSDPQGNAVILWNTTVTDPCPPDPPPYDLGDTCTIGKTQLFKGALYFCQ